MLRKATLELKSKTEEAEGDGSEQVSGDNGEADHGPEPVNGNPPPASSRFYSPA